MKSKIIGLISVVFVVFLNTTNAQEIVRVTTWSQSQVEAAKQQAAIDGRAFAGYAVPVSNDFTLIRTNQQWVYQQAIYAPKVAGIDLFFSSWNVPEQALVRYTNLHTKEVRYAPSYLLQNVSNQFFISEIMHTDSVLFEIVTNEPLQMTPQLYEVGVMVEKPQPILRSGACQVDVNCSEGNAWEDQINSTVRIKAKEGSYFYWCSGTLMNNATYDCKPYVLSAMHCSLGSDANDFNQYSFYFNFQFSACDGGSSSDNQLMFGCTKRADSNDGGGETGSDFVLVELNNQVPESFHAFYAGWSVAGVSSSSGVGVHHPDGEEKTISTYKTWLQSTNFEPSAPANTHWQVKWSATNNGHGTTEPGSSGSALFNADGQVIGTLTGGGSSCSNTTSPDFYGRMAYHWVANPNNNNDKLKYWLDPLNTGITYIDGAYYPCTSPNQEDVAVGEIVGDNLVCNQNHTLMFNLINFGEVELTSVKIDITSNGVSLASFDHNTQLQTGAKEIVSTNIVLMEGKNNVMVEATFPNGVRDNLSGNNQSSKTMYYGLASKITRLVFNSDCDPQEIAFDVFAEDSTLLAQVGFGEMNAGVNNFDYCLPEGCYFVELYDSGNNGIANNTCGNNGLIEVFNETQTSLSIIDGNVDTYMSEASFGFCTNGNQPVDEATFLVYPNPVTESNYLEISLKNTLLVDALIEIIDVSGNVVSVSEAYVFKNVSVDISKLSVGMYTLRLTLDQDKVLFERFIKI